MSCMSRSGSILWSTVDKFSILVPICQLLKDKYIMSACNTNKHFKYVFGPYSLVQMNLHDLNDNFNVHTKRLKGCKRLYLNMPSYDYNVNSRNIQQWSPYLINSIDNSVCNKIEHFTLTGMLYLSIEVRMMVIALLLKQKNLSYLMWDEKRSVNLLEYFPPRILLFGYEPLVYDLLPNILACKQLCVIHLSHVMCTLTQIRALMIDIPALNTLILHQLLTDVSISDNHMALRSIPSSSDNHNTLQSISNVQTVSMSQMYNHFGLVLNEYYIMSELIGIHDKIQHLRIPSVNVYDIHNNHLSQILCLKHLRTINFGRSKDRYIPSQHTIDLKKVMKRFEQHTSLQAVVFDDYHIVWRRKSNVSNIHLLHQYPGVDATQIHRCTKRCYRGC